VSTLESGVHATLAGVALGLLTPVHPVGGRDVLEHTLHPVSASLVIPIFALANAGVDVREGVLGAAFRQQLTWAVIAGLVLVKIVGIAGITHLVHWRRWGALPAAMHPRERSSGSPRWVGPASPCRCSSPASPSTTPP
jgi:Na+:H+ antiporter, NhaA family